MCANKVSKSLVIQVSSFNCKQWNPLSHQYLRITIFCRLNPFSVIPTCDVPKIAELTQQQFFSSLTTVKTGFVQSSREAVLQCKKTKTQDLQLYLIT